MGTKGRAAGESRRKDSGASSHGRVQERTVGRAVGEGYREAQWGRAVGKMERRGQCER